MTGRKENLQDFSMPVEMFLPAPRVKLNGRFEGENIVVEPNLDDKTAVEQLREALIKNVPRQLYRAFRKHERSGWIYPALGGAVLLVGLGYYEFKERKGEDFMSFLKKLNQAKRSFRRKINRGPTE